jgi:RNA polymerase sigma factor (sigma-70 family)
VTHHGNITEVRVGGSRSAEAALYDAYAQRLQRIVAAQVNTARENVEDACHFAWAKYLSHAEEIRPDGARGWLATTAIRQAWKLDGRQRRETSLDAAAEAAGDLPVPSHLPGPAERAENSERLRALKQLSGRQQRLVWLQAAGLSYVEMAAYTGDSVRTVERQILRAAQRVRQLREERVEPDRSRARDGVAPIGPRLGSRQHALDDRGLQR